MQHSYWEIKQFFDAVDYTVVGSGIVGINTALRLRVRFPKAKILILEKGYLPAGASSKNAGFACFGSPSEILDDLQHSTEEDVFQLVELRKKGLDRLLLTCGSAAIDYQMNGSYEIFTEKEHQLLEKCLDHLSYLNQLLYPIFGTDTYIPSPEAIQQFGFDGVQQLIKNQFEGQIDTGKMFTHLIQIARAKDIKILNGVGVTGYEENGNNCTIQLENGYTFTSQKLLIATNGFAQHLLPDLEVSPARAQVLITTPIKNLKIKGTFHLEKGYYYFRNIDNRILLGGGRNLAFKEETTTELKTTAVIQDRLEYLLKELILPQQDFTIAHRWSGIMGVGNSNKRPIIQQLSNSVFCGVRMGGMGVAIGALIGEDLADLIEL
ncbi:MAG: FAD-binding oxidoreductase [Flavobacteriales bacterium]|jgi:glycine/D-amino acid oxidase-like deaminating enzyme|nr:FAD-binding oxidoreductase [Flavobacteriales bacterium]